MIKSIKNFLRPKLKYILLKIVCPYWYKLCANSRKVVKNKVVFIEPQRKELSNSLSVIYDRLQRDGQELLFVECVEWNSKNSFEKLKSVIKVINSIADASVIFIDEAFVLTGVITLRKESKLINLWHGCGAFKKFGFSTADLIFGGTREEQLKYPYYNKSTCVTVSSEDVRIHYAEAMQLDLKQILPIGISRTDVFFDDNYICEARRKVVRSVPEVYYKKIILYAPTFRGHVVDATTPNELDLIQLKKNFGEEYVLLIKHHPNVKSKPAISDNVCDFAFDVTDIFTIDELICVSDICVSDYSSLVFEYSLFERPMIFFAYDLEDYYDWRGFYYDYESFVPGPIVRNTGELIDAIKNIDDFDKEKVIEFKKKFMSACDGKSTDRIVSLMRSYMSD